MEYSGALWGGHANGRMNAQAPTAPALRYVGQSFRNTIHAYGAERTMQIHKHFWRSGVWPPARLQTVMHSAVQD